MRDPRVTIFCGHRALAALRRISSARAWSAPARAPRATLAALVCAALVVVPCSAAHAQVLSLRHSPPHRVEAWQPVALEAVLVGVVSPELIATIDAVVATEDGGLRSIPLTFSRNSVFGEIPAALVTPPMLSYYLRIVDTDGAVVSTPPGAPGDRFFEVPVTGGGSLGPPEELRGAATATDTIGTVGSEWSTTSFEILSPLVGKIVAERTPQIAAVFDPPLDEPWDAIVVLDGVDVSDVSSITSELFILLPAEPLAKGAHRVTFSAVTATGTVETSWVFFVLERTEDGGHSEDWQTDRQREGGIKSPTGDWGASRTGWDTSGDVWQVSGRLEAGWAVVAAETTAVESVDVFLPYDEVNRPSLDFYLSGVRDAGTFLITARYNPIYSDELDWRVSGGTERLEIEAGEIFPSLSPTTLNWAVGQGARVSARAGRSMTELVGMRVSEADTMAGFGIYSRFTAGGKQSFDWTEHLRTSLVYVSVFDHEDSVTDEQQLSEPLRNSIVAGLLRTEHGALTAEFELARSDAVGETEGTGTAFRAKLGLERDWRNRVSLEYVSSEPEYYSAGSYEYDPGEHTLELDYSYRPNGRFSSSGWVRTGRSFDHQSSLAEGEFELRLYSRAEFTWPADGGDVRTYVVGRYDRIPYDTYDYSYAYGALGGTWRRGRTRFLGNISWSDARSLRETSTWSASGDFKHELIRNRWTARVAARWTAGSGNESDYTRSHYTFETRWDFGQMDLEVEYWLIDREDRADPSKSYAEHVITLDVGHTF